MKKILYALPLLLFISCTTTKKEYVTIYRIPDIVCPARIDALWEKYSIDKTEEENALVEPNNIAMVKRILQNREVIIKCYEDAILIFRKKEKKDERKQESK